MNLLHDLRPGDFMFGPIGGFIPGVVPVGAGQILLATRKERLSWRLWWKYRHVAVVVQAGVYDHQLSRMTAGPRIVQAMPHGAEEIEIGSEHWQDGYLYVRPPYAGTSTGWPIGERVAYQARRYIDTPYSYLDYVAIEGVHLGIKNGPIRRYVTSSEHMICSQLADQAAADAGWHIFDDGRLPQDVVPAELVRQMISVPDSLLMFPSSLGPFVVRPDGSWGPGWGPNDSFSSFWDWKPDGS